MIRAAGILALSFALLGTGSAQALTLQQVGGNFDQPTYVTSDPGNANRLFVVERTGKIALVENGTTSTFANFESIVSCCELERGLVSMALAPDFDSSGRFYIAYTGKEEEPGEFHVAEMRATGATASIGTLRNVLTILHPENSNHYGGQLQFGPDGYLYVSTGDGGGSNDVHQNAQDLESLLGKILRIDPLQNGLQAYTVPADNPFVGEVGKKGEIWSYGLRNPYRFSFDSLTGDMVIGDVGQGLREEVDFAPSPFPGMVGGAGANYGWNCREGFIAGPETDPQCVEPPAEGFSEPVFDYPHVPESDIGGETPRCAIIGGYVARDAALGSLYGHYLYADLCTGVIRSLQLPAKSDGRASDDCSLGIQVTNPVSFGEDSAHRLYVVEEEGRVYRLSGQPPANCPTPPPSSSSQEPKTQPPAATYIGIQAQRRRVQRGKMALLTVWVSPCDRRKGESVELLREGHASGTKFLSRACTARFLSRIRRGTTFAAATREERGYVAGVSRKLTVRIAHGQGRHRR